MRGMNQKRKRLGLWILFLAALLLTQFTVPVKASEPQIQDVNIQMVGGQIRTIDPMGLRMVACIKKSYIQELEKSGATVSYGIVLLPKKYLTEGQALTLDGKYLYNGSVYKPAKVPAVKKFSEDNDRIYFTAVLANLPKERYKNDYAARAYAEITRTVTEDDGKKKTTTEVVYSESEIDRQVYRIAEEAVNGTTETEETKQWLQDNILAPVDKPEELPEEEKKISFRLGKVSGVTLYHKTTSEAVKKEDYLVKVEMEDQPEIFAVITEVIAPQTETGKVSFKLDRKDYTTSQAGQTIEGAVVEFGTKSNDKVSTKYITMQSLIDQMKANPGGTYTLEHDIDASMVTGHNISFGPKEYSFAGNSTAENVLTNYTENYEYTGSVSNDEGTQTPEHTGKIDKATAAQITNKTFYIDTLKWDEKIWYLDDVAGGKRPRLKAEGDVYGAEEEDTSKGEGSEGDSNNAPSEEVVYIQAPVQDEETEEPQMAGETPTEVISFIAQKNAEEIAAMDSLESVKDYQADRKLIYENLRLFMPFYTYEQIVKDGNKVDPSHVLNKKTVLAVYPMDDRGNRIVALSDKTVQDIKKIRIQFTDETTPLIYIENNHRCHPCPKP